MTERKARTSFKNQRFGRHKSSKAGARPKAFEPDLDAPYWIYGTHAVAAALANPKRANHRLLMTPNAARNIDSSMDPEILSPKEIDKLLPDGAVHQGAGLLTAPLEQPYLDDLLAEADGRPFVFLDQVTDPHNVGAILRSAAAFGAAAVVTTRRHSPPVTGVLAKSASGALEHVPYLQFGNLAEMLGRAGEAGCLRLGLDERGEQTVAEAVTAGERTAFVFGAEGAGLRQRTRETCDALVRLPTSGAIQALNVSNAVAISLYIQTTSA